MDGRIWSLGKLIVTNLQNSYFRLGLGHSQTFSLSSDTDSTSIEEHPLHTEI